MSTKKMNLFWLISILSKGIYFYLWYSVVRLTVTSSNGQSDLILLATFGGMSVICIFLAIYLSKQYVNTKPIIEKFIKLQRNNMASKEFSILVLSLGLAETPAILGLSLSFLYPDKQIFLYFLGASILGWLLAKPNMETSN